MSPCSSSIALTCIASPQVKTAHLLYVFLPDSLHSTFSFLCSSTEQTTGDPESISSAVQRSQGSTTTDPSVFQHLSSGESFSYSHTSASASNLEQQILSQISGAGEQYVQIFLLPCKWLPSFSFLFWGGVHSENADKNLLQNKVNHFRINI